MRMIGVSVPPFLLPPNPTFKTSRYSPSTPNFKPRNCGVLCKSTSGNGSGENENKIVLDAFFLGKAFAEALNERIGSTVGEILSVAGQWQAEKQKQVQVFQEEVVERAKIAKEKAALEAMEDQGLVPKSFVAPRDVVNGIGRPSAGPTMEDDPFQELLKD